MLNFCRLLTPIVAVVLSRPLSEETPLKISTDMTFRLPLRIVSALAAAAALLAPEIVTPVTGAAAARSADTIVLAQKGLPEGSRDIGPLRRGPSGQIEAIDPAKEQGAGPRRCAVGAICVGAGQAYHSLSDALAVARPGGIIEVIGGTYQGATTIGVQHVTIRGVSGRPHFDCANLPLADDKACMLLTADGITLQDLEISGAVLPEGLGANGACIRNAPDLSFTLRRIFCHGSQDGILTDGGSVLIENSEFRDNGWTSQTHNVYFSGNCISVTVRGSTFSDARVGHEFKSRCRKTEISDSVFRSTKGSRDLDIPDGGETLVYRSTIEKTLGAESEEIIGFAAESCSHPGDMVVKDVRIVNSRPNARIHNFDKCEGKGIFLDGVTLEGLPFTTLGYVVQR